MSPAPRPAGTLFLKYSPMSPPAFNLVAFRMHVYVYASATDAVAALLYWNDRIKQKRFDEGSAIMTGDSTFFRGQTEITHRLLPTRLRERNVGAPPRMRHWIDPPEARTEWGDWHEEDPIYRKIEDSLAALPPAEIEERERREVEAIERAKRFPDIAALDEYRQRAAVRHYAGVPSSLLDVSADPEVAAFFATGAGSGVKPGQLGMLWAIELDHIQRLFAPKVTSAPGGWKATFTDNRSAWGVNERMLDDYGVPPAQFEIRAVDLPLHRPTAQSGRFVGIESLAGSPMSVKGQLTWWSLFERWSYMVGFVQDGKTYENPERGITLSNLLPRDDPHIRLADHTT